MTLFYFVDSEVNRGLEQYLWQFISAASFKFLYMRRDGVSASALLQL